MTNRKTTRRALVLSLLSLLLCCSMLVGTTFAWFTDSVQSGKNKIVAGNLDIALEYSKDMASWADVKDAENLFSANLWEPGHTEVVYLRLSNQGTLALKYQFEMVFDETVGTNVDGETFKLSQFLKYDIVDVTAAYANRDAARDAVKDTAKTLATYTVSGQMLSTDADKLMALVVYMPEEVDNKANYKTGTAAPTINLYLNLFATQKDAEIDSFGPDYDEGAWVETMSVSTEAELLTAMNAAVNEKVRIVLANNIVLTEPWTPIGNKDEGLYFTGMLDGNGYTISGLNVAANDYDAFISAAKDATIKNLTVEGTVNGVNAAGIVARIEGETVVENCVNKVNVTGTTKAGGIVSNVTGADAKIINCINDAPVSCSKAAAGGVGGIIGYVNTNAYVEVSSCTNNGAVTGTEGQTTGAVVGYAAANSSGLIMLFENTATITGSNYVGDGNGRWIEDENGLVLAGYCGTPANWEAATQTIVDGLYYNGTDTYYVTNANGMTEVANMVNSAIPYTSTPFDNATVLLMNDIDLGGQEWIPIGDDRSQRTEFHGEFDGQGYTISNVTITKKTDRDDENKSSYGLFGNVKGTIKNLTVSNVSVSGAPKFIGALVGRMNGGSVENCHVVDSNVSCNNWTIGGLVGQLNEGNISGCSVTNTTVTGYAAVGAIAGIVLNKGERTIENCTVKNCNIVQNGSFGGNYDDMFGTVLGATYSGELTVNLSACKAEGNTVKGVASSALCGYVAEGDKLIIDGKAIVDVATADALVEALKNNPENTVVNITTNITDATVKLPAALKNVTITGTGAIKNSTIMAHDGNSISYEGVTFEGLTFENSRISITGWRTGGASVKDLTVTGCTFKNLDDTTNGAPVHLNMAETEPVNGFSFTDNVIDGATGGSKSGVYAQVTGKAVFTGNVINNVAFRPYVIQVTTNDGIADEFIVTGNTFSGSASGRAQGLGNDNEGTDQVKLVVSGNIFKDITSVQQICYWNFNEATTTADLSKNYYDIDIVANPNKIYYNKAAASVEDLVAMGVYPYYAELNTDGTINTDSLVTAP